MSPEFTGTGDVGCEYVEKVGFVVVAEYGGGSEWLRGRRGGGVWEF